MEESVNKSTKDLIDEQIQICLGGLAYVEQGSEQHNALVNDIQKLVNSYAELQKTENAKIDSDRKFENELWAKNLEMHYKDSFERDKMQEEQKIAKRELTTKIISILVSAGFSGLYFLILGLGMRLEFIDHGSVTSFTVKELLKVLHPKV